MAVQSLKHFLSQIFGHVSVSTSRRRNRAAITHCVSDAVELLEVRVVPSSIQVTPVLSTSTTEAGGTAQFTVTLDTAPKGKVTVPLKSSNALEGTVNVTKLIFTKDNWEAPQTFTVKGIDDSVVDGDKAYQVVLGKFKTSDKGYKALAPITVNLTNVDNDVPGINVTAGNNLQTTEGGGKATLSVKLTTKPTGNVTIPLHSSNTAEGTVTASLTFTPSNWNVAQTVTITGVNDSKVDGNQAYQVVFDAAQSSDANYAGRTPAAISLTNVDNDVAGLSITPKTGITINEGASKSVGFKLTAQPSSDVTVTLTTTAGEGQALLSVDTFTFTAANWNVTQNVIINGVALDGIDGDQTFSFDAVTSSADALFNVLPTQTVNATIHDTEAPAPNFDGTYSGSYSGSVTTFGVTSPVEGVIAATVSGNSFSMTQPFVKSGTLTGDGSISLSIPVTADPLSGITFTGDTVQNPDGSVTVSGTWSLTRAFVHGSGTWSITRAPLA